MTAGSIFALLCGFLALAYGVWSVKWILALPDGNDRMREIAAAVQEGAKAMGENLKPQAQEAVESVKGAATEAADTVKAEGQTAAADVKGSARSAGENVRDEAQREKNQKQN